MAMSGSGNGSGSGEVSLLGLDSRFEGTVRFEGTLRVDGEITGDITSPEGSGSILIINAQAVIRGDIVSDSVLISGQVEGSILARERVEIFKTGILRGDVQTGDIMIEGGAEFQGKCHMLREDRTTAVQGSLSGDSDEIPLHSSASDGGTAQST